MWPDIPARWEPSSVVWQSGRTVTWPSLPHAPPQVLVAFPNAEEQRAGSRYAPSVWCETSSRPPAKRATGTRARILKGKSKPGLEEVYGAANFPKVTSHRSVCRRRAHGMLEDRKLMEFIEELYQPLSAQLKTKQSTENVKGTIQLESPQPARARTEALFFYLSGHVVHLDFRSIGSGVRWGLDDDLTADGASQPRDPVEHRHTVRSGYSSIRLRPRRA